MSGPTGCPTCGPDAPLIFAAMSGPPVPRDDGPRREWRYRCMRCLGIVTVTTGEADDPID
jgi:hypothetical protein